MSSLSSEGYGIRSRKRQPLFGNRPVIIPLLIPIALKGVTYRPVGADALLRRNVLIWGLGGVVAPFIGIKLIDMLLVLMRLAS